MLLLKHGLSSEVINRSMCYAVQLRFCSQCHSIQTILDNNTAIKLFNDIRAGKVYHHYDYYKQSELAVNGAMNVYHQIPDNTNYGTMAALMKLFLHFKQPYRVYSIWDDIVNTDRLSYPLLMKCCITTNATDFNMDKCMEILYKMRCIGYKLRPHEMKDFSTSLCKLISKCKDYDQWRSIQQLIEPYYDIYNQTALISKLGKIKHPDRIQLARNIFDRINKEEQVRVSINAMMTLYVNDGKFIQGLEIYDTYVSLRDHVSHKLALRACVNLDDKGKGYQIANRVHMNEDLQLKTSLIDFYGHFHDLESAMNVFNSLQDTDIDITHIGALMKAFIYNNRFGPSLDLYDAHENLQNDITDLLALTACRRLNNWSKGNEIVNKIREGRYEMTIELQNGLIDFYRHFHQFDKVNEIFKSMDEMNTKTINSVMMNLMNDQDYKLALDLFDSKNDELRNNVTYILAMKACINIGDENKLLQLLQNFKDDINLMMNIRDDTVKYNPCVVAHTVDCLVSCGKLEQCKELILNYEKFLQNHASPDLWLVLWNGSKHDQDFSDQVYKDLVCRFEQNELVMQEIRSAT